MSEKLIIEGFAGIKKLAIELRKINVFIGPQATGKSVTAKLLYFFKGLMAEMHRAAAVRKEKSEIKDFLLDVFDKYFPRYARGNRGYSIRYEFADQFVALECPGGEVKRPSLSWSGKYEEMLQECIEVMEASRRDPRKLAPGEARLIKSGDSPLPLALVPLLSNQIFVPAGRSFFAVVQQNVFTMLSAGAPFDPFLTDFGAFYERSKQHRNHNRAGDEEPPGQDIGTLVRKVLGAQYVAQEGEDYLQYPDGRVVDLAHVSSGQQEALPLTVMLERLTRPWPWPGHWSTFKTIYVEEPEAHLFPATQRLVVELLATVFNTNPENLQFVVTTHSPYILTAMNNLLQAGQLDKDLADNASARNKLRRVVPKARHLNAADVSAYYFDGKSARSILSRKEGLIAAEAIDKVSEKLAIQFDKMLDIGG